MNQKQCWMLFKHLRNMFRWEGNQIVLWLFTFWHNAPENESVKRVEHFSWMMSKKRFTLWHKWVQLQKHEFAKRNKKIALLSLFFFCISRWRHVYFNLWIHHDVSGIYIGLQCSTPLNSTNQASLFRWFYLLELDHTHAIRCTVSPVPPWFIDYRER